ncbi:tetratricopeptide repeat protein [Lentilactobacillus kosonis]|uniref:Uncharacterized protein n=1 Tax=Lentilactobacillus kosonis TaxID=2810561 RepID=A0A401FNX7_9LACO|nr:tetratricopeptide repeat protein [Lentilactobacillus kosonis]GAY74089.1 hypothetical protein NBRC111893_2235 [Lentilactobacillus kosonis]
MKNDDKKVTDLQKKNQENQRKYMRTREQEEEKAKQIVHKLVTKIDQEPNNYHNYYELATVLVEGKDYEQAEELLMKALGLFSDANQPATDLLKYGLGNVYYAAEEYDKAIDIFQNVEDHQLKVKAYVMLAQSYMAKGDNKRAMVFALTAQSEAKDDPEVNKLIGDNLLSLGNFQQAGEFYDLALKTEPDNGPVNFDRGLVAMVDGENYQPYFEKAKQLDPDYYEKGQQKLQDIEKFIQINKDADSNKNDEQ